eukprot:gene26542-57033_t
MSAHRCCGAARPLCWALQQRARATGARDGGMNGRAAGRA